MRIYYIIALFEGRKLKAFEGTGFLTEILEKKG